MTRFLVSDSNPNGRKLEDILLDIRSDVLKRCTKIAEDHRPEALQVLANNVKVLEHLTAEESIRIQESGLGGKRHMGAGVFLPFEGGRNG